MHPDRHGKCLQLFLACVVCAVKPQKTELFSVTKIELNRQVTATCNIKALQNTPIGAFCDAIMLFLVLNKENYI